MRYPQIIESIFVSCKYKAYLELGIYDGETFDYISKHATNSMSVDIKDLRKIKHTNFFLGTTDDFFNANTSTFDCIFIDANHNIENVLRDFNNSIKILNDGGTIFIHDTSPEYEKYLAEGYCSNAYLINKYLVDYSFVTLPADDCGLTIIRKPFDFRFNKFIGKQQ